MRVDNVHIKERIEADKASIIAALKADSLEIGTDIKPSGATPSGISGLGTVYMSIEGLIDVEAEIKKIQEELVQIENHLKGVQAKLANSNFMDRAPKEVVAIQEAKEIELKEKKEKLEQNIAMFNKA